MGPKPPIISFASSSVEKGHAGLVKSLDSVELLAIRRSGFDGFVRAKVRVKDGELAGRCFITQQPKTDEDYSPREFPADEIAAMRKADEERDRKLSPNASVVAVVEGARTLPVEPMLLVEPEPYNRFKPFLRKK